MAIKSEILRGAEAVPRPFPKLMRGTITAVIVLFSEEGKGMVVSGGSSKGREAGYYSTIWSMSHFEDFNETVALRNE